MKELFEQLVEEFRSHVNLLDNNRIYQTIRVGAYPEKDSDRYNSKSYYLKSQSCFNSYLLQQYIRNFIIKFEAPEKIVEYFIENKLWINNVGSYEQDILKSPSISFNIAAGFLIRNFELNEYKLEITDNSFNKAINELTSFLNKDTITITTYLSLYGPSGNISEINITNNIKIVKASYEIVKQFGLFYSTTDGHYIDMFESDYVLIANITLPKKDYIRFDSIEKDCLRKSFLIPLLAGIGNIEAGKKIRASSDWAMPLIKNPNAFYNNLNGYNNFFKSEYFFDNSSLENIKTITAVLNNINLKKIDWHILKSIERLKKSKSAKNFSDRILELSLALEYLINTKPFEVTLQLCLKVTKLFDENNLDEKIYYNLKKFYDLRSNVVHGNKEIDDNSINKELVNFTENVVLKIIIKLLKFNQEYNFKHISSVLNKCLYINLPFSELIMNTNNTLPKN